LTRRGWSFREETCNKQMVEEGGTAGEEGGRRRDRQARQLDAQLTESKAREAQLEEASKAKWKTAVLNIHISSQAMIALK